MKIRPLIINGKEIPLREPTELQVLAHLRAGSDVDATYLILAWIGELGAANPRKPGESVELYAHRVVAELAALGGMMDIVNAADACWGDAIDQAGILPSREEAKQVGEPSSEESAEAPSSSS